MGRGSGNTYGSEGTRQSIINLGKAAGYSNVRARATEYRRSKGYVVTGRDSMGRHIDLFGSARWLQGYFRDKQPFKPQRIGG